jgi:uncharacterized protein YcbK (DUF882 family)
VAERKSSKASLIVGLRRVRKSCVFAALILLLGCEGLQTAIADGDTRALSMHHMHTDESITITFKSNGRYDESALKKLNWFLRDWRREEQTNMDPRLFDLLWEVNREVGAQKPIEIVCGYRSPQTNAMLRRRSSGVARFSQHTLGRAMDFYIPGVALEDIRIIGLRLQRGGVGYYPTSGSPFVHLDTGNVRHWPRMSREQLARVFPDGRTVHIPSDGRPLAGYALALADLEKRGSTPSAMSLASARDAGVEIGEQPKFNLLAALFNPRQEKEEDEDNDNETASQDNSRAPQPAPVSREPKRAADPAAITAALSKTKQATYELASIPSPASASAQRAGAPGSGEVAANIGPWSSVAGIAADDGRDSDVALAYASPSDVESTKPVTSRATPMGVSGPRAAGSTTTLQKTLASLPSSKSAAPLRSPEPPAAYAPLTMTAQPGDVFDDPWFRALVIAPNIKSYMILTSFETPDFRELRPMMEKPAMTLKMTFSVDPNASLTPDHFTGNAVVFLSTVNFPTRTAALQLR